MIIGNGIKVLDQKHLEAKGIFFVGGKYCKEQSFINGQMFIEVYVPRKVTKRFPIIFFHGAAQTNICWLETPDGRAGWADYFLKQGYIVYLAETPARGRSAYHPSIEGEMTYFSIDDIKKFFVGNEGDWEQAVLHTQWPDKGQNPGEEVFDQFSSSQLEYLPSNARTTQLVVDTAQELLDRTGPAILLTHSQAGPFGWVIADRYREKVKGIIAIEPTAPCFSKNIEEAKAQNYGIADIPLSYEPPLKSLEDFKLVRMKSGLPGVRDGLVMEEPARKLPNLKDLPIVIVVGEASYHAERDYWFSYVLKQAGVDNDYVNLGEKGIHGNGHMMMLEKNSDQIAEWMNQWMIRHIKGIQLEISDDLRGMESL